MPTRRPSRNPPATPQPQTRSPRLTGRPITQLENHQPSSSPEPAPHTATPRQHSPPGARSTPFRPDIEGLRCLAIVTVLLYHACAAQGGFIGVDVFFVISGFLITGILAQELSRTGSISTLHFYSRRIKRLLPLVALVLTATAVLSHLLLSPTRQPAVAYDIASAGLYIVNWHFAIGAVNYSTAGLHSSPVLHFWSLAVEGQFYAVWPLLLLAMTWRPRRPRRQVDRAGAGTLLPTLRAAVLAVAAASFVWNLHASATQPSAAYFLTGTRGWELALGGLLALAPSLRLPQLPSLLLGIAGIAAIALATAVTSALTPYPGTSALLPTLGAAAIILSGAAQGGPTLPSRLLSHRSIRHIGRVSYAWYLWHWPFIIFAASLFGPLSVWQSLLAVAASYPVALTSHLLIERPAHRSRLLASRPVPTLALGAVLTVIALSGALALLTTTAKVPLASATSAQGAPALLSGKPPERAAHALAPRPTEADRDRDSTHYVNAGCFVSIQGTRSPRCVYGDPASPTTVVLLGDSHAMQYFPTLEKIAEHRHWRLVGLTKAACPPALTPIYRSQLLGEYSQCDTWRKRAFARIASERPAMVIVSSDDTYHVMQSGHRLSRGLSASILKTSYTAAFTLLLASAPRVVVIRDIPHPDTEIPACVALNLHHLLHCALPRRRSLKYRPTLAEAAHAAPRVHVVSPIPALCTKTLCPAVIGNVLVYRNGGHLTATYARTLAPWLSRHLPDPTS